MTTTPAAARAGLDDTAAPSRTPLLAALALGVAVVLNAVGSFSLLPGGSGEEHSWGEFLTVVGFSVLATAVVFGLVVRTAATGDAGRRALVLGVIAAASFVVFWAGITAPLAVGAIACALVERDRTGRLGSASTAGTVLAGLALVAVGVLAVIG